MILSTILNQLKKDELCGEWSSCDGSGLHRMFGSWMKVKRNGTGKYESWGDDLGEDDEKYNYSGEFTWNRIDKRKISIRQIGTDKTETIEYDLLFENGRIELTSSNPDLEKDGMKAFWNFAQIMFKK